MFAVRNEDIALDVVQEAMMKLAEKYGDHSPTEWPMLFQRILQNAIRDSFRRSKVRSFWVVLMSTFSREEDDQDPMDNARYEIVPEGLDDPDQLLERRQLLEVIEQEIQKLPARQREAFLMRYWEEMNIAETASAMGCSEGSVKTHCSRATHTLAAALEARGITL